MLILRQISAFPSRGANEFLRSSVVEARRGAPLDRIPRRDGWYDVGREFASTSLCATTTAELASNCIVVPLTNLRNSSYPPAVPGLLASSFPVPFLVVMINTNPSCTLSTRPARASRPHHAQGDLVTFSCSPNGHRTL